MTHNTDGDWIKCSSDHKPDYQTPECSHDVIIHDALRNNYYIGFYCYPSKKWIDSNTNNDLYNPERWRYFKK